MHIAFDIRRRVGFGVATYVRNVVRTLARIDGISSPQHTYFLIASPEQLREYRDLPSNFQLEVFSKPASSLGSVFAFRDLLKRNHIDLLHVPHLFKTPRLAPCPVVVTAHDLLDFLYQRPNQTPMQSDFRLRMARFTLKRAQRIIAVSNSTKADVLRYLDIEDPDLVEVVYNGIDERFLRGHASDGDRNFIAERYQVNYPFLLYAGSVRAHKNVGRLIEAFSALKAELKKTGHSPDLRLIIIGEELSSNPELRRTMVRSGVQSDVRFMGFVPLDALRIFYDLAKIFVFPSLYEGFGLPPLEAMAHGTPVVTSNASSLPEVVGNAAVLVNPENVFDIMHGIRRVLLDQQLRDLLKQRGYEQARKFSWERSVRRLLQVYQEAAFRRAQGGMAGRA